MGRSPGGRRGARGALLLALLLGVACRLEGPAVTGLRIVSTWTDVDVDQLEFTVTDEMGSPLVSKERRPEQPHALTSGADLVIYFADSLGSTLVHADVSAYSEGRVVGVGQASARLSAHTVVEMTAPLSASLGAKIDGSPCGGDAECESNVCADGVCCATECTGTCRSCAVPGKQGTCSMVPEGVKHASCADQGTETCGFDGTCDGRGTCRHHPLGTRCAAGTCNGSSVTAAGACDGNGNCVMGPVVTCAPFGCDPTGTAPHCFDSCTTAAQCVTGRECVSGSCGQKLTGASCGGDAECLSGFCADGVCCESRCDGACVTCAQVGAVGTCRPTPSGVKDPRGVCKDDGAANCGASGSCDGAGNCASYAAGTICRASSCMGDTMEVSAGRCDGAGNCIAGQPFPCAPYRCSAGACNQTCTRPEDCAAGIVCMLDKKSCGAKGIGQPCQAGSDCASGFCVDKVCCQEACTGPCRSCTLGPVPGVCTMAASGNVDPRGMCKDQGKSSCGTDGTCTATGTCHRYAPGTLCGPGTCNPTTNLRTLPAACDNGGACAAGAQVSCGNYKCNGNTCFAGCGSDVDCVSPATCVGGVCSRSGVGAPCMKASDCSAPYTCVGTTCQLKPLGISCKADNECSAGHCTDGVCCETASCGACHACNVSGFIGYCHASKAGAKDAACGAQAASTCGHDGTCDGAGNCQLWAANTPCSTASCNGRYVNKARVCDGKGICRDAGTTDCMPYQCNPATNTCFTSCQTDLQCCCSGHCRGQNTCFAN